MEFVIIFSYRCTSWINCIHSFFHLSHCQLLVIYQFSLKLKYCVRRSFLKSQKGDKTYKAREVNKFKFLESSGIFFWRGLFIKAAAYLVIMPLLISLSPRILQITSVYPLVNSALLGWNSSFFVIKALSGMNRYLYMSHQEVT